MTDMLLDLLRVTHMAAFAVGIGAATFLETQLIRRFKYRVDQDGLRFLLNGHDMIRYAVYGLWGTGLALLILKVGILGNPFTAKLAVKLLVVALLTANMVVIERFVLTEMFFYEGKRLRDIPSLVRLQLGAIAGVSAGCWIMALLLGGVNRFLEMGVFSILGTLIPILIATTAVGAIAAYAYGRKPSWPRPVSVPAE